MNNVIEMVRCPYCDKHIVAEAEMVCEQCVDKVTVDLSVSEILSSITSLEALETTTFNDRKDLLQQAVDRLQALLEE